MELKGCLQMNLHEIGEAIQNRIISPVTVVNKIIQQIERVDPKLNVFVTLAKETALDRAREVEAEIAAGLDLGPLHGVPVVVKDNIFTRDLRTTMGSEIYQNYFPAEDAFVVEQLRRAGAIILGKVNTHQFAYGPTGDRSFFGPVKNPYDLTKMTGGSSSGSAAAVAACMAYGALGTDTGGSIRIPASFCGIVGMKPTYGRISKRGVYPLAYSLDHVGPMTRTVYDNALMLNALQGMDEEDLDQIPSDYEDFTARIGEKMNGKVIGVPTRFFNEGDDEEISIIYRHAIQILKNLGATVKRVHLPEMGPLMVAQRKILQSEAYEIHVANLNKYPDKWDEEVKDRVLTGKDVKATELVRALNVKKEYQRKFALILDEVDVLFTPTMMIRPPKINQRYARGLAIDSAHIRWTILKFTSPFNILGLPALSVPAGFCADGLPIGMQFIGAENTEANLYQIGAAFEKEINVPTAKLVI